MTFGMKVNYAFELSAVEHKIRDFDIYMSSGLDTMALVDAHLLMLSEIKVCYLNNLL